MKTRFSVILIVMLLMVSLSACGGGNGAEGSGDGSEATKEKSQDELYDEATAKADNGEYADAVAIFRELGDFKDSKEQKQSNAFAGLIEYVRNNGQAEQVPFMGKAISYDKCITSEVQDLNGDNEKLYAALDKNDQLILGMYKGLDNSAGSYSGMLMLPLKPGESSFKIASNAYMEISNAYTSETTQADIDISQVKPGDTIPFTEADSSIIDINGNQTDEKKSYSDAGLVSAYVDNAAPVFFEKMNDLIGTSGIEMNDLGFEQIPFSGAASDASEPESAKADGSSSSSDVNFTFDIDEGTVTYKGWKYAPEGFLATEGMKPEDVIIIMFDYTNKEDEDKRMTTDFFPKAYQNSVELETSGFSYYPGKCKEVDDFNKSVLKGGTITCARYYKLQDDSPVTVIVQKQGSNEKKQFEIKIK